MKTRVVLWGLLALLLGASVAVTTSGCEWPWDHGRAQKKQILVDDPDPCPGCPPPKVVQPGGGSDAVSVAEITAANYKTMLPESLWPIAERMLGIAIAPTATEVLTSGNRTPAGTGNPATPQQKKLHEGD